MRFTYTNSNNFIYGDYDVVNRNTQTNYIDTYLNWTS